MNTYLFTNNEALTELKNTVVLRQAEAHVLPEQVYPVDTSHLSGSKRISDSIVPVFGVCAISRYYRLGFG